MSRSFRISRQTLAGALFLGALTAGCGDDRVERGLAPASEPSTPESATELREPEANREEATTEALQGGSDAEFDAKEGAAKEDGAKPPAQ